MNVSSSLTPAPEGAQLAGTTLTGTALAGTALVLGGGGSSGNAWLIGVVAGLCDAGLEVTRADLTVGTSAGSTAAAQFAGATPSELFAATIAASPAAAPAVASAAAPFATTAPTAAPRTNTGPVHQASSHLDRLRGLITASSDIVDMRRRLGEAVAREGAIEAAQPGSLTTRWRTMVAARLPGTIWPTDRRVCLTAVDVESSEPVVFDRESGVELIDAVAASCAGGGFAYRIGERSYIDGGYRSNPDNADLASGYRRILVLSPLGGDSLFPAEWGQRLEHQVAALRAGGSRVETVFPGAGTEHLFGANAVDVSLRPAAARAGYAQGRALAPRLSESWATVG